MSRFREQAGDTIVEVLIAIAVVSAVLGSAYVVVNRTLDNALQAQEHTEALKVAEAQLEQLKAATAANASSDVFDTSNRVHCFDSAGNLVEFPVVNTLPQDPSTYPAACISGSVNYRTGIVYEEGFNSTDPLDDVFKIYVNWPGPTGGQDQVSLVYKVYRETP